MGTWPADAPDPQAPTAGGGAPRDAQEARPAIEPAFPGRQALLAALDEAVGGAAPGQAAARVRAVMSTHLRDPAFALPAKALELRPDGYARHELHRSLAHGYAVVAMAWGPGQCTPLHDHGGSWCVDAVWRGELVVTPHELLEVAGNRHRFRAGAPVHAGPGDAGCLQPPGDHHIVGNRSRTEPAFSVHVYQSVLEGCACYLPDCSVWHRREAMPLQR